MRALIDEIFEAVHARECHPPAGKAHEDLRGGGAVPFAADLDQVVAAGDRHVVEQLDAGVVVVSDWQEERQPEAE